MTKGGDMHFCVLFVVLHNRDLSGFPHTNAEGECEDIWAALLHLTVLLVQDAVLILGER